MRDRLSVDPQSVTDVQVAWLSAAWRRIYTVNIDDIEQAAQSLGRLPAEIRLRSFSALSTGNALYGTQDTPFVHLNGALKDVPDVPFSPDRFGERSTRTDAHYRQFITDTVTANVVDVGTRLNEPTFWHFLAMRQNRGARGTPEMRRRAFLVTPTLSPDRRELLREFHIEWIGGTSEAFAEQVFSQVSEAIRSGIVLRQRSRNRGTEVLLHVARLVAGAPEY